MLRPDRGKPLSGNLGGRPVEGLGGGVGSGSRRASSVPRVGVAGGTPAGGALDLGAGPQHGGGVAAGGGRAHSPTPPPADPPGGADGSPAPLPCLSSNNSTETPGKPNGDAVLSLSAQKRKSACALAWNVQAMADRWGIERLGFLTLTFADLVLDPKEAQRRFNSLKTHVLRDRYRASVRVFERCKSGRIHYHLLVVLDADIRTGFDFAAIKANDYRSAGKFLRDEWAFWRRTARRYGFGRTELLPVRSSSEAVARYVGKYISKNHQQRQERDRHVRLVEYSGGARMAVTRFAWCTENAAQWRAKVATFAGIAAARLGRDVLSIEDLSAVLGPRWAYRHREFIFELPPASPGWSLRKLGDGRWLRPSTGEILEC